MQPDQVTEGEYRVITHPRPGAVIAGVENFANSMAALCLRSKPVDATHWLNRSAGVSKSNVFLGRALSRYFFELKGVPNTTKFGLGC
jgi:hypothetical protein